MGLKLAIDGYGADRASLAYLQKLPVHQLKIEGVQTAEDLSWLAANDFDAAQGYAIARPMPPEELRR